MTDIELDDDESHFFTPEQIAELDRISAKIDAGAKVYSIEEIRLYFDEQRNRFPSKPEE